MKGEIILLLPLQKGGGEGFKEQMTCHGQNDLSYWLNGGSGIAIGIQSKGTAVIHQKGLPPLNNLELLSQASNATSGTYHTIGRNAARYAKGNPTVPLSTIIDNMARLKYIVQTTLMHMKETQDVQPGMPPRELKVRFFGDELV
jgi:propanediol dehydratase medium subunit